MADRPKPCLFCGSEIDNLRDDWETTQIECPSCDATGPEADTQETAVRWWNEVPRPANIKAHRSKWSSRLYRKRKAVVHRRVREAREEKIRQYNSPEAKQIRADLRWTQEREAWLNAPVTAQAKVVDNG